jgi:hypothetical protein
VKKNPILPVLLGTLVAGGVLGGTYIASADGDETVRYTDSRGVVNVSKMPEDIPVMGRDGRVLVDAEGKPVTISRDKLFAPPEFPASPTAMPPGGIAPEKLRSDTSEGAPATGGFVEDLVRARNR